VATCPVCKQQILPDDPIGPLRSGDELYHVACAPSMLIESVAEEYQAILKKGVRYFVEKYSDPSAPAADFGSRFLALGRAVEVERERRQRTTTRPDLRHQGT
jgi:hypothetical protein